MVIIEKVENGPVLLCPDIHGDSRGYFYESFNEKFFRENVCDTTFVQDNQSRSSYGVIRGMHFQKGEHAQAKLVRVVKGAVLDVILDIRKESENYGKYYAYLLSEDNHYQLFVPRGFAHGFVSLRDDTIFQYKCDNLYNKESEGSYRYDSFGFNWNHYIPFGDMKFSDKDKVAPSFIDEPRRYAVISKETMREFVSTQTINSYNNIITNGRSVADVKLEFSDNIFADIKDENGEICTVKLDYLAPFILPAADSLKEIGNRQIVCHKDNGEEITLSSDFNEVNRFYGYGKI